MEYDSFVKRSEYKKQHSKLHYYRGSAREVEPCINCGNPNSEWSQIHGTSGENIYTDYVPRCRRCHLGYDNPPKPTKSKKPREPFRKLSDEDVRVIRERAAKREKHAKIAKDYGVSRSHVTNIISGHVR